MTVLSHDIAAYDKAKGQLEAEHRGEWAVFRNGDFVGLYADFEDAASDVVERFGGAPCLIRQIGVESIQLSSAMIFKPSHAYGPSGI